MIFVHRIRLGFRIAAAGRGSPRESGLRRVALRTDRDGYQLQTRLGLKNVSLESRPIVVGRAIHALAEPLERQRWFDVHREGLRATASRARSRYADRSRLRGIKQRLVFILNKHPP